MSRAADFRRVAIAHADPDTILATYDALRRRKQELDTLLVEVNTAIEALERAHVTSRAMLDSDTRSVDGWNRHTIAAAGLVSAKARRDMYRREYSAVRNGMAGMIATMQQP